MVLAWVFMAICTIVGVVTCVFIVKKMLHTTAKSLLQRIQQEHKECNEKLGKIEQSVGINYTADLKEQIERHSKQLQYTQNELRKVLMGLDSLPNWLFDPELKKQLEGEIKNADAIRKPTNNMG